MDADPLRAARPEEGPEKPKGGESQDDGYETSNSGSAAAAGAAAVAAAADPEPCDEPPPSAPTAPPPPAPPSLPPAPAPPHHEHYLDQPLMRPYPSPYRQYEQPEPDYQHFPFPKYSNEPYAFKREPDAPYDMTQHHHHPHHQYPKRDDDLYNGIKRECDDPYSFVEEEAMSMMLGQHSAHHAPPHHDHAHIMHQQMMLNQPKKRGRKKKIKDENGMEIKADGCVEGVVRPVKERKKHDRFNGMSEEEVARRTLPDHLAENLDIIIIGINPGLFAAYKGHHYAGPGNHFWKCLYLSGLTREQMSADEDYKLLNFGIGFTNMVSRPTKGSADLTRREIKEGSAILLEKLQTFRPKVAVFNGKLIYEVFSGKKEFCFGKQPDSVAGTNTYMWVMPSSSARCAQLPRAADKVPFYAALKKFRDYLNGLVPHLDETELVFPDNTARRPHEEMEIRRLTMEPEPGDTIILEDGTEVPLKKKRGRPKKVKLENGEVAPPTPRAPRAPRPPAAVCDGPPGAVCDGPPKKKRGRPKKIRPEDQQVFMQQQQQLSSLVGSVSGGGGGVNPHEPQYFGGGGGAGAVGAAGATPTAPPSNDAPLYLQQQPEHDPYYHHNNGGNSMDQSTGPLEMSLGVSGRAGYGSPGGGAGGGSAGGGAGAGGAAYPSPVGRGAYPSPRSQGYSPGRHQPTPQPQFPSSPTPVSTYNTNQYPGSPGVPYPSSGGRGGGPLSSRSPLYGGPPAPPTHSASYANANPAAQPSPQQQRFTQSPQYSRSPAPQRPYSRSPLPAGAGAFACGSPGGAGGGGGGGGAAGALHSYTPSPQHTPYSQHSSPAPIHHHHPYADVGNYRCEVGNGSTGSGVSGGSGTSGVSGGSGGALCELSADIGAAIGSNSPPASPPPALDFDPPRDSPIGSTDMHPGSNSNSSLSDYNKTTSQGGSELSPAGVGVAVGGGSGAGGGGGAFGGMYGGHDTDRLSAYRLHTNSPHDKDHYHYAQEQGGGGGVASSPRLEQMHTHPNMYPNTYNRSTPESEETGFRPPDQPHTPHTHHPGSPAEYVGAAKTKPVDVASKSLSGLESLVDQIPSIADGPAGGGVVAGSGVAGGVGGGVVASGGGGVSGGDGAGAAPPVPQLTDYAPALYGPYGAYAGTPYPNNGYSGPFVGYGGGWGGVMRPTPGYLSDWQYGYAPSVPPAYPPYTAPYYNGYTGPPQQTHYLSAPPLLELHKNGEQSAAVPSVPSVPSVGFGGFC